MNATDSFNLTVSNNFANAYSDGKYNFGVHLPSPLHLQPYKWKVGVAKVIIPHSKPIYLRRMRCKMMIYLGSKKYPGYYTLVSAAIDMPGRSYYNIEQFAEILNNTLGASVIEQYNNVKGILPDSTITFKLKVTNGKVSFGALDFDHEEIAVLHRHLEFNDIENWHNIGFTQIAITKKYELPFEAILNPIHANFSSILLLSAPNLIEDQPHEETSRPILDIVPYYYSSNMSNMHFDNASPTYKTVIGGYINKVEIEVADMNKDPIVFEQGKFQIVLEFKKCQS